MNRDTAREVNRVLRDIRQRPGAPHMAVVTDTAPLTVQVAGESVDLPAVHLASYTPAVSDTVLVLMGLGPALILGEIVV